MTTSKRSIEVDFFRGLALVVIMLDHIPSSLLSKVTLHNFAFCDAAEVFVFVGGYSTAAAYMAIDARQGESAAMRRFLKRGVEIYRAFLVTAALMLTLGMLLLGLHLDTPAVGATEAATFIHRPFGMLLDIATLRRQPFLSAVLPMYAMFALCAPLIIGAAKRAPWWTMSASVAIWYLAPTLADHLPSAYPEGWSFNPFAWQIMFTMGAVVRFRPLTSSVLDTDSGRSMTRLAIGLCAGFAIWQLFLTFGPSPGYEKQNLALIRLLNFGALAWVAAWMTSRGWVYRIAQRAPALVRAGRQSLPCFVGGACISVSIDALSRPFLHYVPGPIHHWPSWIIGALCDACAIVLLLTLAWVAATLKERSAARHRPARPRAQPANVHGHVRAHVPPTAAAPLPGRD